MSTRQITMDTDELVVKAGGGATAAAGVQESAPAAPSILTPSDAQILSANDDTVGSANAVQGRAIAKAFLKNMNDALQRKAVEVQEASPVFTTLLWNLATAGPFSLGANPPSNPNRVIGQGTPAMMLGISYADPGTLPVPTNMYLAGKGYRARFSTLRVSGPVTATSIAFAPSAFTISPFHLFLYFFIAPAPANEGDLYDVNFDIDISTAGVPGAGFAEWHYDPDSSPAIPIGVPGTGPHWQNAISGRFMVNRFPF